jgi:predicted HTH domain antitoxin
MDATLSFEIPRDVLESARMTVADAKLELAIALFAVNRLSMGKAAELAGLPIGEFQLHLGARHLGPHYGIDDAREDRETLAALRKASLLSRMRLLL